MFSRGELKRKTKDELIGLIMTLSGQGYETLEAMGDMGMVSRQAMPRSRHMVPWQRRPSTMDGIYEQYIPGMTGFGMDYAVPGVLGGWGQGYVQPSFMESENDVPQMRAMAYAYGSRRRRRRMKKRN